MFHSRLYLAPNITIIENMLPLQHAELHLGSLFDCSLLDSDGLGQLGGRDLCKLIQSLRSVYSGTVGLRKYIFGGATIPHPESVEQQARIHHINRSAFPAQHELGHWAGRLPTGETARFFRKLDAVFAALEEYHITPLGILTAFLHSPVYKFHIRAARLLQRWQLMISKCEARGRWTCKYNPMMNVYKRVHRRAADM
ncbi:hypothetical protein BD779DRAFT_816491 [Infundibulicybe gibba]|nr:hypothetical protein BD779DRAFT_816491 [Infundibulicybe gibba]